MHTFWTHLYDVSHLVYHTNMRPPCSGLVVLELGLVKSSAESCYS